MLLRVYIKLKKFLIKFFIKRIYNGHQNRSESDNGLYLYSVNKFIKSNKSFNKFKRDIFYREILEHVSEIEGQKYLSIIRSKSPDIHSAIHKFGITNDTIGSPVKYKYGNNFFSPTTLRYVKVVSDLKQLFGENIGDDIVEIGGGYGGQLIQIQSFFSIKNYFIYDLPLVNKLTSKYVSLSKIQCNYHPSTIDSIKNRSYDLAISNYAFSELPKAIQLKYIEIFKKCKRGYLTMNSGNGGIYDKGKLTLNDIKSILPNISVFEENPKTYKGNYIIVWGNNNNLID